MTLLASRIVKGLKTANHFAVYEADLELFWPLSAKDREAQIARFAEKHGLRLRFYKTGLCAIFEKDDIDGSHARSADFAGAA
jgi:hypothetical protein